MAKKKKTPPKEYVPVGMNKKDYADAAFRKKVTIIMGCILLAFITVVCGVLINAWAKTEKHNQEFEAQENAFLEEKAEVLAQLEKAETAEEKAKVQIVLTDENFSDWISTLDNSYQVGVGKEGYAAFEGASIKLQGIFVTREFGEVKKTTQYWVQRYHSHDDEEEHEEHSQNEIIPMEVISSDKNFNPPENNTWVEVTGIVGIDTTKNLSAVRDADITVMEESGEAHVH